MQRPSSLSAPATVSAPATDDSGRGPVSQRPADLPLVPERIDDPTQAPAVLVADRSNLPRTDVNRPPKRRIRIIDDQQSTTGRATNRMRAEPPHVRRRGRQPECSVGHRQLHNDVVTMTHPMQNSRAKRRFVELDRRARTIDLQLRLDVGHRSHGRP